MRCHSTRRTIYHHLECTKGSSVSPPAEGASIFNFTWVAPDISPGDGCSLEDGCPSFRLNSSRSCCKYSTTSFVHWLDRWLSEAPVEILLDVGRTCGYNRTLLWLYKYMPFGRKHEIAQKTFQTWLRYVTFTNHVALTNGTLHRVRTSKSDFLR